MCQIEIDIQHQKMVTDAMHILMYDVGTPISGSVSRVPCVYFRPREAKDQNFVKIQYGTGCSAHVSRSYNDGLQTYIMNIIGRIHESLAITDIFTKRRLFRNWCYST